MSFVRGIHLASLTDQVKQHGVNNGALIVTWLLSAQIHAVEKVLENQHKP